MTATNTQVWTECDTPLGRLTLTASELGLDGLAFAGSAPKRDEANRRPERFELEVAQLTEYFAGSRRRFELPLDLSRGTAFQQAVWHELQQIPFGQTLSYSELGLRLGRSDRVRAVGAAVGRTPIPIIVPCHRVVAADGKLTGYIGGLHRKQGLLELETAVRAGQPLPSTLAPRQLALI